MVIPRENIIEVARLAILQLLLVSADADGRRRRVDDNMIIEVSYSCDVVIKVDIVGAPTNDHT
eukprot:scaffold4654_cov123-Skeletonema_menzelii.AAC.12